MTTPPWFDPRDAGRVLVVDDAEQLAATPAGSIDVVIALDLLDTVPADGRAERAGALARVLRPGGLAVVGVRTMVGGNEQVVLRVLAEGCVRWGGDGAPALVAELLRILGSAETGFVPDRPHLAELAAALDDGRVDLASLLAPVHPTMLAGVTEPLGAAGLAYLGPAGPPAAPDDPGGDVVLAEMVADVVGRRARRVDLFRRDAVDESAPTAARETDTGDGYVVDVPYIDGIYSAMLPVSLSLAGVLHRRPALPLGQPFTYLELGCGTGLTALVAAATAPAATIWGCDLNPAHVARARDLARRAGLTNAEFAERSFDELVGGGDGPAAADVVALHGVFSWVGPAAQAAVLDVVRERLRPGGLVYVSYDAMTGWAGLLPLRELMRRHAATDVRPSDVAVVDALAAVERLRRDGVGVFPLPSREQEHFDLLTGADPAYVAHEYLGGELRAWMFAEVAEAFGSVDCEYVGSASPAVRSPAARVPSELLGVATGLPDRWLSETFCDLAGAVAFRRDVYRRDDEPLDDERWADELGRLRLVRLGRPHEPPTRLTTAVGEIELDDEPVAEILSVLAVAPATVAELRDRPALTRFGSEAMATIVSVLVAGGWVASAPPAAMATAAVAGAMRLNEVLIDEARAGRAMDALVAPALGTVVGADRLTLLGVGELWDGAPLDPGPLVERIAARATAGGGPPAGPDDLVAAAGRALALVAAGPTLGWPAATARAGERTPTIGRRGT